MHCRSSSISSSAVVAVVVVRSVLTKTLKTKFLDFVMVLPAVLFYVVVVDVARSIDEESSGDTVYASSWSLFVAMRCC
jgi:hypothetical protein